MADKDTSPAVESSTNSPVPKKVGKSSPTPDAETTEVPKQMSLSSDASAQEPIVAANTVDGTAIEALPEDTELEADDGNDSDSGFGTDTSDSTSISSSIVAGYVENGRRYQTKREGEYWGPADEKQFLSMEAAHIVAMILESKQKNPLFLAPISETAQYVLDIGTGSGVWAVDVADRLPSAVVYGIDLSPPPADWVPPNCWFEVDDVLKPWEHLHKYDLVHIRDLFGSFNAEQWRLLYKQAYNNIVPGGWIEQFETSVVPSCDDSTLPADSLLANWGNMFFPLCQKMDKEPDTIDRFKERIKAAGFTNIHEKVYKVPVGDWAKDPLMKEAGSFCKTQFLGGLEGYVMFILTHFGEPSPWTTEEVQVFLAKVRQEVNAPGLHAYFLKRRVWAQKPLDAKAE